MTIEELGAMPMIQEAEHISTIALGAQADVEQLVLAAERQALQGLQETLGTAGQSVSAPDLIDRNIVRKDPIVSPQILEGALPLSERATTTTRIARTAIGDILLGADDRIIVITGPCSIHSPEEALAYAQKIAGWRKIYGDKLEIVMRAFFEKPRSEVGWKGLAHDPRLNGSDDINLGLTLTRLTALRIAEMGVPMATERLSTLTPQYTNGLFAYDAIGARNAASQISREYASGTSPPIGIKNAPDGNVETAVSAVVSANKPHSFPGISASGMPANVRTAGQPLAHIILRGGDAGPNYSTEHVKGAVASLQRKGLLKALLIDASHGNSNKQAEQQRTVIQDVAGQIRTGKQPAIKGVMLESYLRRGKQDLIPGKTTELEYGISGTDECIDIKETELLLEILARAVEERRKQAAANA